MADLARVDQFLEGAGGLRERDLQVGPVHLVDVDVLDVQRLQAFVDPTAKPVRTGVAHQAVGGHPQAALGRDHNLVSPAVEVVAKRPPEQLFRDAEAVALSGVEQVDAQVARVADRLRSPPLRRTDPIRLRAPRSRTRSARPGDRSSRAEPCSFQCSRHASVHSAEQDRYPRSAPGPGTARRGRAVRTRAPPHVRAMACELLTCPGADGARVHPRLARGHARESPFGARCDLFNRAVVGQRGEDDVCCLGDLPRRVTSAIPARPAAARSPAFAPRRTPGNPRPASAPPCSRPCDRARRTRDSVRYPTHQCKPYSVSTARKGLSTSRRGCVRTFMFNHNADSDPATMQKRFSRAVTPEVAPRPSASFSRCHPRAGCGRANLLVWCGGGGHRATGCNAHRAGRGSDEGLRSDL